MNPHKEQTPRIFLSYAAADRVMAQELQKKLSRAGASVFTLDMLSAGEEWQPKLREAIAESDVFAVLLTKDALDSAFVLQELGAAWALGKRLVVVAPGPQVTLPLDISVDAVVTDLTALDSLLQVAGRSSRSGESEVEAA